MTSQQINLVIKETTGIDREDFDSDLNACHVMEQVLTHQKGFIFASELFKLVRPTVKTESIDPLVISATAAQRCEAFLRCIGRWTEDK